ncbi:MAG TPA: hypothetical protein VFG87_19085 [Amycolatopsis sp.]|nr:hypothetical protein [Amycolatopsis sp.]
MADGGYQVETQELNKFADYLKGTTGPVVSQAAGSVHSANGFDNNAFGVFVAQLLAVPARIAMGVVAGNLDSVSKEIADAGDRTAQAATTYDQHEQSVVGTLQSFKQELDA